MEDHAPSVTISPLMRALYAGMVSARRAAEAAASSPAPAGEGAEPEWTGEIGAPAAAGVPDGAASPFRATALRRNGARPLRFDGAQILAVDVPPGEGRMSFTFALHLGADGTIYGAAAARPAPDFAAAEMHVAEALDGPDALDGLLEALSPEEALPDPAVCAPGAAEGFADARWAIRQDFDAFSASLRRLAPPAEPRTRT